MSASVSGLTSVPFLPIPVRCPLFLKWFTAFLSITSRAFWLKSVDCNTAATFLAPFLDN